MAHSNIETFLKTYNEGSLDNYTSSIEFDMTINVKLVNDIIEIRGSDGILLEKLDNQNSGLYIYFKSRVEKYGH